MIFVDASAMISMITGEDDAGSLADRLDAEPLRLCSPLSVWEPTAGPCRTYRFSVESARDTVRSFLTHHGFRFVGIGEAEFEVATDAYARFGKGGHLPALNMGDCYAYDCTRTNLARLLFKGEDFGKMDIAQAL